MYLVPICGNDRPSYTFILTNEQLVSSSAFIHYPPKVWLPTCNTWLGAHSPRSNPPQAKLILLQARLHYLSRVTLGDPRTSGLGRDIDMHVLLFNTSSTDTHPPGGTPTCHCPGGCARSGLTGFLVYIAYFLFLIFFFLLLRLFIRCWFLSLSLFFCVFSTMCMPKGNWSISLARTTYKLYHYT